MGFYTYRTQDTRLTLELRVWVMSYVTEVCRSKDDGERRKNERTLIWHLVIYVKEP